MKKLISILAIFCFTISFSQIKVDLTKKQAYERFKNSNVRKACGIKLSEFNQIYKTSLSEGSTEKLSNCAIYNNTKDKKLIELISTEYARGTSVNPYSKTTYCADCYLIIYNSIKAAKEYGKEIGILN